jgi:hypothetical protein
MRRALVCTGFVLVLAALLMADANLRITDVGLHGYSGSPSAVRLIVRNPSSQAQAIHLRLAASNGNFVADSVTAEVELSGGEQRELELPLLIQPGKTIITADASVAGAGLGHDSYGKSLRQGNLIVMMCANDSVCKAAQAQIQFSGTIEERADKNRQVIFEMVTDPRDHWWAYSASHAIVLAMPTGAGAISRACCDPAAIATHLPRRPFLMGSISSLRTRPIALIRIPLESIIFS